MKLAWWSGWLLLAACTSSPTPEDDLNALNARVATTCRAIMANRDVSVTVNCLNAALPAKTVALAEGDYWEAIGGECIEHWSFFAVDGEVRIFERLSGCLYTYDSTVDEQTCPGPFSTDPTAKFQLQATGCTIAIGN